MKELPFIVAIFLNVFVTECQSTSRNALCAVYDPFKVQPDNNKFQVGGAFPLHDADCVRLRPKTVQDIVAIQWALTHWNQNPANSDAKLGLYAGDTCSRPKEAISQTLRFLDSVGYHEPDECIKPQRKPDKPRLLSLISPKDRESAEALGIFVRTNLLPVAAYSTPSADGLVEVDVENMFTTAPTLSVYVDVFIKLMTNLHSNLVTIVENSEHPKSVARIVKQLERAGIHVAEVIPYDHPVLAEVIADSDSQIILSYIEKEQFFEVFTDEKLLASNKMWVTIPVNGDGLNAQEQLEILRRGSKAKIVSLQPRSKNLAQFKEYFLRVLKNNYQSYSLLTAYVEQVFNCSMKGDNGLMNCADIERNEMSQIYKQASTVEYAVKLTYVLAVVGARVENITTTFSDPICDRPTAECNQLIMDELESLDYVFGASDPAELNSQRLQFYRNKDDSVLISSGIIIEGILLFNDDHMVPMVHMVIEYETGSKPRVVNNNLKYLKIRSQCAPYRPFCGTCKQVTEVDSNKYFLSIPKEYPLYIMALFDFHDGRNCQSFKNSDISLPMSFIHTIWTFRKRYPQLKLLQNLDFGALLVDSCSIGKTAAEVIIIGETQCFTFQQADRNITIVPGSVFGYVSGVSDAAHQALRGIFATGEIPLIALSSEHSANLDEYSTMPSSKFYALALIKLLKKFNWDYVTAILSQQDSASLAVYGQFERLASERGICISDEIHVDGEHSPEAITSSTTNVTLLFTTAADAANFFAAKLRRESSSAHVYVVIGDAHDFYLHDPSNVAKLVGTVSLQPKDVSYDDFRQWLEITTPLTLPEQWYWRFVENRWQCALLQSSRKTYNDKLCTGDELLDVPMLGRMTRSGYLSRGVERFLFAMDVVYRRLCPEQTGVCSDFYRNGRKQILNTLKKVRTDDEFEVYEFLPDKQSVGLNEFLISGSFSYRTIGNWSLDDGLRFTDAYKNFDINGNQIPSQNAAALRTVSRCEPPLCKCWMDKDFFKNPLHMPFNEDVTLLGGSYVQSEPTASNNQLGQQDSPVLKHITEGQWHIHGSNYAFLVIITLLILTALAVLLLICVKVYLRVVKGNQSLGISLLVGIIILYFTGYAFVFDPSDIMCRLRIIMHPMGYALCFGVMIAKATQLRNAETIGFSHSIHISFWNYWLLLFFILGVQIALSVRWVTEQFAASIVLDGTSMHTRCTFGVEEFLLSQTYVVLLLILALFINSRNRNIKRNYKETKWLFIAALTCVLLWMAWMITYVAVSAPYKDMVIVVELMLCASVLLIFLFGPKIYILLSYEPVIVEYNAQAGKCKDGVYENGLFEKDDEMKRSVSPTDSYATMTQTSLCNIHKASAATPHSIASTSGACSDEQGPIFHTVIRKKNRLRRVRSDTKEPKTSSASDGNVASSQIVMPSNAVAIMPSSSSTALPSSSSSDSNITRKIIKKQRTDPNHRKSISSPVPSYS